MSIENLLTDDDTAIGYSKELLPEGDYILGLGSKISAKVTPKGKRKIKVGLRPISTIEGEAVRGKFVNFSAEIDRVTLQDGTSFNPAGKLFGALGIDTETANAMLTAIHEAFPASEEVQAAEFGQVDLTATVGGEPLSFEGRKVAAHVVQAQFNDNTYNEVKYWIGRDKVAGLED